MVSLPGLFIIGVILLPTYPHMKKGVSVLLMATLLVSACQITQKSPSDKTLTFQEPALEQSAMLILQLQNGSAFEHKLADAADMIVSLQSPEMQTGVRTNLDLALQQLKNIKSARMVIRTPDNIPQFNDISRLDASEFEQFKSKFVIQLASLFQRTCAYGSVILDQLSDPLRQTLSAQEMISVDDNGIYVRSPGCIDKGIKTMDDIKEALDTLPVLSDASMRIVTRGAPVRAILAPYLILFERGYHFGVINSDTKGANPLRQKIALGVLDFIKDLNISSLYNQYTYMISTITLEDTKITFVHELETDSAPLTKLFIESQEGRAKAGQLLLSNKVHLLTSTNLDQNKGIIRIIYENPDLSLLLGDYASISSIATVALLSTVGFVSYQGYMRDVRPYEQQGSL